MNELLPTYELFSGVHLALLGKSEPESMFWWLKYRGLRSGSFSFGVLLSWDRPSLLRRKATRSSIQSLQCRVFHMGFPVNIPLLGFADSGSPKNKNIFTIDSPKWWISYWENKPNHRLNKTQLRNKLTPQNEDRSLGIIVLEGENSYN